MLQMELLVVLMYVLIIKQNDLVNLRLELEAGMGSYIDSELITVSKKAVELTYATTSIDNKEYGDSNFTNALTITGGVQDGQAVPVTYESNNTDVATVVVPAK